MFENSWLGRLIKPASPPKASAAAANSPLSQNFHSFHAVYSKTDAAGNAVEISITEMKIPETRLLPDGVIGPQMSQEWIENVVDRMLHSNKPAMNDLGQKIRDALNTGRPSLTGKVFLSGQDGVSELPLDDDPIYNGARYT